MAHKIEMYMAKDGSFHKTEALAALTDVEIDGRIFMKILDDNIKIDHGCVLNHYEVLAELTAFLVNNNIHKSQLSMQEFIIVLEELGENAGEE